MPKRAMPLLLALSLLQVLPVHAQTSSGAEEPATKEEVIRLMDVLRIRKQMEVMRDGMRAQMKAGAEHALKTRYPDASPEVAARMDALLAEIFADFPMDELVDALVPIYQKYLSKQDVNAAVAFYLSPSGQKLLDKTPQMMAEAMEAGGAVARRQSEAMHKRIEERIRQLGLETPAQKK